MADQRRHHLLRVGDDGEVGALDHLGVQVGVDGHDMLHLGDALQMLRRAGDAECEVAARGDQAARCADLPVARQMAFIANDAAAGPRRAEHLAELGEAVPVGDAVAGAENEIGLGQRKSGRGRRAGA